MRKHLVSLAVAVVCPLLVAQQQPSLSPVAATSASQPHTLLDGTPVKLRLTQTVSSADATVNQEIPFEVVDELRIDNIVVLPKGGTAIAMVTEAEAKKRMGRGGKLNLSISYARLADGEKVALRAVKESKGGSHTGAMTGAMVATSLIVWPAAPFFLFMHGKDITIPAGTEITAFIEGDMHLDMAKFGGAPASSASAVVALAQASLQIDSSPVGADVEIDGNFVGNTPSTVTVATGTHEIAIKKKGFSAWTRKMNVTGGSIHLNADLERHGQ